jgi:predicted dinucleotide-binding enzyme
MFKREKTTMSTISFIGIGGMARAIATRAVAGGNTVELIGRDASKAHELATTLGQGTKTGTYGDAPEGEIVILAVPYTSAVQVVSEYGDALGGKVIVDISNPFNADLDLVTPEGTFGAKEISDAAPDNAHVVKAFNTVFGHVLAKGVAVDVLLAGDDKEAKAQVSAFIESLGLQPRDAGGLKMARYLEAVGPLTIGLAQNGAGFSYALGVNILD